MSEIPYCANCSECRDDAGKDRAGVPDKKLCYPHALEIANGWRDGFASLRAENERLREAAKQCLDDPWGGGMSALRAALAQPARVRAAREAERKERSK